MGVYVPDQESSPPQASERKLVQSPLYSYLKKMLKKKVLDDDCESMVRQTLFKGGHYSRFRGHYNGVLQWERDIELKYKEKWEFMAKEQSRGQWTENY